MLVPQHELPPSMCYHYSIWHLVWICVHVFRPLCSVKLACTTLYQL